MKKMAGLFPALLLLSALFVLGGCGSAGTTGSTGTAGATGSITGLASSGAPLAGAVTLKDSGGVTRTAQIDNLGGYSLDVTGLSAPFILRAGGFYSFAAAGGRVNINPLSSVATALAANYAGGLDALYADDQHLSTNLAVIAGRLSAIALAMEESLYLAGLYAATATAAQRDFLNGVYQLDQGIDRLFAAVSALYQGNAITLTQTGQNIPFMTIGWIQGAVQPTISVNPVMTALLVATLTAARAGG